MRKSEELLLLVVDGEEKRLVQPSKGKDATEDMYKYQAYFLKLRRI
jgi:hypothetical protein